MICPKCNSLVSEESRFCSNCGFENSNNYNNQKKNKKKVAMLIISAVLVFTVTASVFAAYFYVNIYTVNKQVSAILQEIDNEKYKEAKAEYDKILSDTSNSKRYVVIDKVDKKLVAKIEALTKEYIDKDIDYSKLDNLLNGLGEFASVKDKLKESETQTQKYKKSRQSVKKADEHMEKNEYIDAITRYKEVIAEDSNNYNKAQAKIATCTEEMYDYYLKEAEKLSSMEKYEDAYKTAKLLKEYYPDDEDLAGKMDLYLKNLYDSISAKADEYNSQKRFDDAIRLIESIDSYFPDDNTLAKKIAAFEDNKQKAIEEERQRRENRKKELIAKMSKRIDKDLKVTIYVPKGYSTWYVNIDNTINIEPRILVTEKDFADLIIFTGFIDDNWVNFDKLMFEVDGEKFDWEVPSKIKKTQVIYDVIGEWSVNSSMGNPEFMKQLEKIANAKNAKVIFEGDRRKQHTVTSSEKKNLKNFIELYNLFWNYNNILDYNKATPDFSIS